MRGHMQSAATKRDFLSLRVYISLLCAAVISLAAGVQAGIADTPRTDMPLFDNQVYAMAESNGTLYLGGLFNKVGAATGPGAVVDSNGVVQYGLMGTNPMNSIAAAVPDGQGGWFVGGSFTQILGQAKTGLAHILANGTVDTAFTGYSPSNVRCLAFDGSRLFVGGRLVALGVGAYHHLAAVDANPASPTYGRRIDAWVPNPDSWVLAMKLSGNTLYVGGSFATLKGGTVNCKAVAAIDKTTGDLIPSWSDPNVMNTANSSNGMVDDLAVAGSHIYIVGGNQAFDSVGGQPRALFARISSTTGAVDATFRKDIAKKDTSSFAAAYSVAVSTNYVFVGGWFGYVGGTARSCFAAINRTTGAVDTGFPEIGVDVMTVAVNGDYVYVGGTLAAIGIGAGYAKRNRVGAIQISTKTAAAFDPNVVNGLLVNTLAIDPATGQVFIAGNLSSIGGSDRKEAAAIDVNPASPTYKQLLPWDPQVEDGIGSLGAAVHAIAASGNTVFLGGDFRKVKGVTCNRFAAVDAITGVPDTSFPDVDGNVYSLLVVGNTLYLGGRFINVGGQTRKGVAAIDIPSKTLISGFNPANLTFAGTNGVMALGINQAGTRLFIGGDFTDVGGGSGPDRLAALDAQTGAADTNWTVDADALVRAIAVDGNTVYVGGEFIALQTGSVPREFLAAIDGDTASASYGQVLGFNPVPGAKVYGLSMWRRNLMVGGEFTPGSGGGLQRYHAAGLNMDTEMVMSWDPDIRGTNDTAWAPVRAFASSSQMMFVGGTFTRVEQQFNSQYFVAYDFSAEILDNAILPSAAESSLYSHVFTADGTSPTWSASGLPAWLTMNANGTLTGTPPLGSGNASYTFDVTVNTTNVAPYNTDTNTVTLFVEALPVTLPFTTGFENGQPIPGGVAVGSFARFSFITPDPAVYGNVTGQAARMDAIPESLNWPLQPSGAGQPGADDPAQWQAAAGTHMGAMGCKVNATGVNQLFVTFDWVARSDSRDWYANVAFEVNDGSGWRIAYEQGIATSNGVYRAGGALGFENTSFLVSIAPGPSVSVRLRWLCKWSEDGALKTALFVDNLSIENASTAFAIVTGTLPVAQEGALYNAPVQLTGGGVAPITWSYTGTLPAGITFNTATGTFSGTPGPGTRGSYPITVNVSDGSAPAQQASRLYTLVVDPVGGAVTIQTSSLPDGVELVAYGPVPLAASGGAAPYTWSYTGTLPGGMTLNASTGQLSGTPAAGTVGSYPITVTATDSSVPPASSAPVALTLVIQAAGSLVITTTTLPGGTQNAAYVGATLQAQGGTAPYTWSVLPGELPAGMAINAVTGALSGTPTESGRFDVLFTVTDSTGASDTQLLTIVITASSGPGPGPGPGGLKLGGGGGCAVACDEVNIAFMWLVAAMVMAGTMAGRRFRRSA